MTQKKIDHFLLVDIYPIRKLRFLEREIQLLMKECFLPLLSVTVAQFSPCAMHCWSLPPSVWKNNETLCILKDNLIDFFLLFLFYFIDKIKKFHFSKSSLAISCALVPRITFKLAHSLTLFTTCAHFCKDV